MGYIETSKALLEFIDKSPSPFHAVANFAEMLEGFTELREEESWKLEAGKAYYVCRNSSSVLAFRLPKNGMKGIEIAAAHSDCPVFKIKHEPEIQIGNDENAYVKLNVEKYGGMLMAPWFDRPLSIAGRAVVRKDGRLKTVLVDLKGNTAIIPNLAIHMNRQANDGYAYNAQTDMLPLIGSKKGRLDAKIAEIAGVDEKDVVSSDLFLYNAMKGTFTGIDSEYISSRALDDLMCAWSCMTALKDSEASENMLRMAAVFDNEEVGSSTKQGADSTLLSDTLERIADAFDMNKEDYKRVMARSFMLSCDNGHAMHPNYVSKNDLTNKPVMNGGVLIKYNANQKYTTDAVSDAVFRLICEKADVPCQSYHNRSDIAGGSTLGNISGNHVSINTIDIGLAQLAMHSPYETAGAKDAEYLVTAVKVFFGTEIDIENGDIILK